MKWQFARLASRMSRCFASPLSGTLNSRWFLFLFLDVILQSLLLTVSIICVYWSSFTRRLFCLLYRFRIPYLQAHHSALDLLESTRNNFLTITLAAVLGSKSLVISPLWFNEIGISISLVIGAYVPNTIQSVSSQSLRKRRYHTSRKKSLRYRTTLL